MLMVVTVHYNSAFLSVSLQMSEHFNLEIVSVHSITQSIIESLAIVCVNCFLVITGFYGIRFKGKKFWNLWVVLFSIYIPCEIAMEIYHGDIHLKALITDAIAFTHENYYAQCYLMLLFLSPILNTFIEKYGKRIVPYVLGFWCIEFVLDFVWRNKSLGFDSGYGLIHFVLMYMLGRTVYLYKDRILKISTVKYVWIYFLCTIVTTLLYLVGFNLQRIYGYSNPLTILAAFSLFFAFLHKSFYNKWINRIASSTFAVFILHTCAPFCVIFQKVDVYTLLHNTYGMYLLIGVIVILSTFITCIVYDQLRIWLTKNFTDRVYGCITNYCQTFYDRIFNRYG